MKKGGNEHDSVVTVSIPLNPSADTFIQSDFQLIQENKGEGGGGADILSSKRAERMETQREKPGRHVWASNSRAGAGSCPLSLRIRGSRQKYI